MFHKRDAESSRYSDPFKTCPSCGREWTDRTAFLTDPEVMIIGYQAHFEELTTGLFLFNHSCGTTFSLPVHAFTDLYNGPVFRERKTGSPDCQGYCLKRDCLGPCPAECECAFVREIIGIIGHWPKTARR